MKRDDIVRHLEDAARAPRVDVAPPHEYLTRRPGDDPVAQLRELGVATRLLALRPETCDRLLRAAREVVRSTDFVDESERLRKGGKRFDVCLPPRGYCWEVLQRILRRWRDDPASPWNALRVDGVEPRVVEFWYCFVDGVEATHWDDDMIQQVCETSNTIYLVTDGYLHFDALARRR